jgi:hypothetical protein
MTYRVHGDPTFAVTMSNKESLNTHEYKSEPEYVQGLGFRGGYSFKHFWSNCHFLLGEVSELSGIQQLCHHYYLKGGSNGVAITAVRIRKFLGIIS